MLTPRRIEMLVERGDHARLIEDVLANGRPLPLSARLRLCDPDWAEVVALGLASRRLAEFAGALDLAAEGPARRLCGLQRDNGSFGHAVPTAAAIAGLRPIVSEAATLRADRPDNFPPAPLAPLAPLALALDRAEHALHCAFEVNAAEGSPAGAIGPLDAALTCWLLADTPAGAGALDPAAGATALIRGPAGTTTCPPGDWKEVFAAATEGSYARVAA